MVTKTAGPLISFLAKTVAPKLLKLTETAIKPGTAKIVGGAGGAVAGGALGSAAAPEGQKSRGFLLGAITGGVGGALGGKALAGLAQGGAGASRLKSFATEMQALSKTKSISTADYLKGLGRNLSRDWASAEHLRHIPNTPLTEAPLHRALLSTTAKAPIQQLTKNTGTGLTQSIGNMARNVMTIAEGGYGVRGATPLSRTFNVLKAEANQARYYTHKGYRYKRSLPGQALGVTLGSGLGFGALDAATASNSDGTPAPLRKRLFKGTTTALGWGLAAPALGTKALLYDIPKTLINPES